MSITKLKYVGMTKTTESVLVVLLVSYRILTQWKSVLGVTIPSRIMTPRSIDYHL